MPEHQRTRAKTEAVTTNPPGAEQSVDVKTVAEPVNPNACANHPDRDAVFTTPEDAGFAQTKFCKECAESLPPGPLRTAYLKEQTQQDEEK